MPDIGGIAMQRWYAQPDDMLGEGWCVMTVDKTPVYSDPARGELQVARYLSREDAESYAELHNARLAGRPGTRPAERYRVSEQDAEVFDKLGETITGAIEHLQSADRLGLGQSGELIHIRKCLHAVLAGLDLMAEILVRVRSRDPG